MGNRPRVSSLACDIAEAANEQASTALTLWQQCWEDRRLTQENAMRLTLVLQENERLSAQVVTAIAAIDHNTAEGIAVIRGGINSPRARRLRAERET
jgi:tartrate dehydratase alpha subunit/fumarate hydratase class I-like protein